MKRKTMMIICIIVAAAMGLAILIPAVFGGFISMYASAKTAQQYEQEAEDIKNENNTLSGQRSETLVKKRQLDEQILALDADIADLNRQMQEDQAQIDANTARAQALQKDIVNTNDLLKKRLRVMYEKGSISYLDIIFSASSFSDLLLRTDMVQRLLRHDQDLISKIKAMKAEAENKKAQIQEQKRQKAAKLITLDAKKKEVAAKNAEAVKLIEDLESKIEENRQAIIEKNEAAERARQEAVRNRPTQPAGGQAPPYTGAKLGWPCALRGTITSEFGMRIFKGVPNKHTGIDIAVPTGTAVFAAESGIVTTSGWDNSYGRYIIINHGSFDTLYAHNSQLQVNVGDKVSRGQQIALSGNTGNSTGPHLHFGVIDASGEYVNPRPYIF